MKKLFYLIVLALIITSCRKVITEKPFPELGLQKQTDAILSRNAWLEQIAKQKKDSIDQVNALSKITGIVDQNSLLTKKNMFAAWVEVNDASFKNVTCYVAPDGTPFVDLAMIFAPNINIDPATGKTHITYNDKVTALLNAGYVKYIHSKGIKVGMDLLGNHDAASFTGFMTHDEATDFARHVASEMRRLDMDAISFDDEYSANSNYSTASFVMVVSEIKRLLPEKLVICDLYAGAYQSTWNNLLMGDVADVGTPATYSSVFPDGTLNFPVNRLFFSEKWSSQQSEANVQSLLDKGYKGIMNFDFGPARYADCENYCRSRMKILKKKDLIVIPGCVDNRELQGINNTLIP
ncbi:glycoside hydrolase family 18 protein [Pedobacter nototheniae]|uniref:hypothetical protein n=1 Tax=Pedobacter nototheniae TaxID=2488994 RepID=UPI00103FDF50|nr:hypothetical protein [Pedobacter nototheniae]